MHGVVAVVLKPNTIHPTGAVCVYGINKHALEQAKKGYLRALSIHIIYVKEVFARNCLCGFIFAPPTLHRNQLITRKALVCVPGITHCLCSLPN
jgi:hypothetical protein